VYSPATQYDRTHGQTRRDKSRSARAFNLAVSDAGANLADQRSQWRLDAPHLPHGYAVMTTMALIPAIWTHHMNPRERAWRRQFYPDITDWGAYDEACNP